MIPTIIDVKNLTVHLDTPAGKVEAVRGVSLSLKAGEVLGLMGESGSGKSIFCKSLMGLLPKNGRIVSGQILAEGKDLAALPDREKRKLRGSFYSMIFQDPLNSLDPTFPVGKQIAEAVTAHGARCSREQLRSRVLELMEMVGIERAGERSALYPYHFSGGMRQRCVMAIALAGNPKLLLADEPTTALDVTIQAQILDLLREVQKKLGTATILVTHDPGVIARAADRAAVMYAGKIVEIGTTEEIFHDPKHSYTRALLSSLPALARGSETLPVIPGMPPSLIDPPKGDAFACRNPEALAIDYLEEPPMFKISDTHYAATWLLDPRAASYRNEKQETGWGI